MVIFFLHPRSRLKITSWMIAGMALTESAKRWKIAFYLFEELDGTPMKCKFV